QAHLREQEVETGGAGEHAEVGGQGDDRPGPGGDPVHGGDHRDRRLADALDDVAGHAGEVEQGPGVHLQQLADDVVDVASRAEPPALAGDDEDGDVVPMRQLGEEVPQVGVHVEGEGVETVGPVEGHGGDAVGDAEVEVVPRLGEPG